MVDDPLLTSNPGTEAAQAGLYAEHALPLRRTAFLLTGSTAVGDELVHDAFEQVV